MKTMILIFIIGMLIMGGCIRESLKPCKNRGDITLNIYSEKFGISSDFIPDEVFSQKVLFFHCIIYRESQIFVDTLVQTDSRNLSKTWKLFIPDLSFGKYECLIMGNYYSDTNALNLTSRGYISILNTPDDSSKDFFAACFTFSVDCECNTVLDTKLRRLTGILRIGLENIPESLRVVEYELYDIYKSIQLPGSYTGNDTLRYRQNISSKISEFYIATLPTLEHKYSALSIKLFEDTTFPYYQNEITNSLFIKRNFQTNLTLNFLETPFPLNIEILGWEGKEWIETIVP